MNKFNTSYNNGISFSFEDGKARIKIRGGDSVDLDRKMLSSLRRDFASALENLAEPGRFNWTRVVTSQSERKFLDFEKDCVVHSNGFMDGWSAFYDKGAVRTESLEVFECRQDAEDWLAKQLGLLTDSPYPSIAEGAFDE